jgi:hypothetical protein
VQVVDILRDDQQLARPSRIEPGQRVVRGIGRDRGERAAAPVVEVEHRRAIPAERLGRADLLDAVIAREAVGSGDLPIGLAVDRAKRRHAGFGGHAGPGEDHDVADVARHAGLLSDRRGGGHRADDGLLLHRPELTHDPIRRAVRLNSLKNAIGYRPTDLAIDVNYRGREADFSQIIRDMRSLYYDIPRTVKRSFYEVVENGDIEALYIDT